MRWFAAGSEAEFAYHLVVMPMMEDASARRREQV
jgi:hypothetical protein